MCGSDGKRLRELLTLLIPQGLQLHFILTTKVLELLVVMFSDVCINHAIHMPSI
jgi:hypothetical protein